jgi:hypothetical protein
MSNSGGHRPARRTLSGTLGSAPTTGAPPSRSGTSRTGWGSRAAPTATLVLTLLALLGSAAAGALAGPTPAFAAGSGYTPTSTPTTGGTASGLAGTVVTSTTVQPSGGTASGTVGSSTITATVPPGTFTGAVQVVMTNAAGAYRPPGAAASPVVVFGIGIYVNGSKVTGTFPAVTVTITSPAITLGSTVYLVTASGLQSATGAAVRAGSASFSITSDPVIEVTDPVGTAGATASGTTGGTSSGTAVAGATSVQTGQPFLLEELAAVALLAFGALILVALRLRRTT